MSKRASGSKKEVFRVYVSGLARGPVKRDEDGIEEEDQLGYFFWNRKMTVTDVRLVLNPSDNTSKGFGFVEFEDEESFEKALTFDGKYLKDAEVQALWPSGKICVQKAIANRDDTVRNARDSAAKEREKTNEMEKALRLKEARVREMERELIRQQERQRQLQEERDLQQQRADELEKQREIKEAERKLVAAEAALSRALKVEEDRTAALEELSTGVDNSQFETTIKDGEGTEVAGVQKRIKNTFLEFYVPDPVSARVLKRGKTAPAGGYPKDASNDISNDLEEEEKEGDQPPLQPSLSRSRSPWVLQRQSSVVSRALLEEKMEREEAEQEMEKGDNSPAPHEAALGFLGDLFTGQVGKEKSPVNRATVKKPVSSGRREVRLRNAPVSLSDDELLDEMRSELSRLWQAVHGQPLSDSCKLRIARPEGAKDPNSWAARLKGVDVFATFADPSDAQWLVEHRGERSWASVDNLCIGGKYITAEWPIAPPTDLRRCRFQADTDVSSQISYNTAGTVESHNSKIAKQTTAKQGGFLGFGAKPNDNKSSQPQQNRTVVLEGIPRSLPVHTVQSEILGWLKRAYARDGFEFNPVTSLHKGIEGGISIPVGGKGRGRGAGSDENNGVCVLRLRSYADAKWIKEQARITIDGKVLQIRWAGPK